MRDTREKLIQDVIRDFDLSGGAGRARLNGGTVTIWLTDEYKAAYQELQRTTDRQFAKLLRELIQGAIDAALAKTKASASVA